MVAEYVGHVIPWTKPKGLVLDEIDLAVDSEKGICSILTPPAFATVDGFLRFLPTDTSPESVRALLTASGGEELDGFRFPSTQDGRLRPRKDDP